MPRTRVREVFNGVVNNGSGINNDNISLEGADLLTVMWTMLGTVTLTDITPYVSPVKADGVTYAANGSFPSALSTATISDGANIHCIKQFDVRGLGKISIRALNNGAAPATVIITAYTGGES